MHDLSEETYNDKTPTKVPSNAPANTSSSAVATGVDPKNFYGSGARSSSNAPTLPKRKKTAGSSYTVFKQPSPPSYGEQWREPQLVSEDDDDANLSKVPETITTSVWDSSSSFAQPDWGVGSAWDSAQVVTDAFGSNFPPIDGRTEAEELNWWDLESIGAMERPGAGMLAPCMLDKIHNPDHSLFTVSINPFPPTTASPAPSSPSSSSQSPSPSSFTTPTNQEILEAVPHPHAYYCRKHNSWVLFLWRTSSGLPPASDHFTKEAIYNPLPSQDRRKRTTSCLDDSQPLGRANKTHHFHHYEKYADARSINPAFHRKSWEKEDQAKKLRRKMTLDSAMTEKAAEDENQMAIDSKEEDIDVIPGVIPVKFVDDFTSDKERNPSPGKNGQFCAYSGWETILTIIENKLWRGNNKALPVNGKTFTSKVGWNLTVRKIFESLGFSLDAATPEEVTRIAPPSTDPSSESGRRNRERLLRAWVEISAYLQDYRVRHSNNLKDYEPHKLYVKAESARESYQQAVGAHPDQIPRGGLPANLVGSTHLDPVWERLGVTPSTYDRELIHFAYLANCRCDPSHTILYFEAVTDLLSNLKNSASTVDTQEMDIWVAQERSRGRFTSSDLGEAVRLLGFGFHNDLQVDYEDDVDDEFLVKAWRSMIRNTWNDGYRGSEKRKTLNDAFKIVAEYRHSRELLKLYDEEVTNAMTPDRAYSTLEVPQTVDEEMLITVYNMRIDEKPSQIEKMRDALKCISEFTRSERLQKFLETGSDPGVIVTPTRPDWPRGLNQLGNTCYLNSLLQYFYTIKDLRDAISSLGKASGNFIDDNTLKDDDLKNHRVGGRIVSKYEVMRSRKFVSELANLFWHLEFSETPAVTPTLDLAKLALVTSKDEEEDDGERSGGNTDSSHSTDATLVDESSVPAVRETSSTPQSPPRSSPPLSIPKSKSASPPVVSSPTSILGKRPRELARKRTASGSAIAEAEGKPNEKEEYVLVSKPATPSGETQGSATPLTIDDDGDSEMKEASSSNLTSTAQGQAPPLPPRPKAPKTQGTGSDMMFGKQHDVAECMDNCMFQIETGLSDFGNFAGADESKRSIVKRLFYGKIRQRLVNVDSLPSRPSKNSLHEREDYFSHLPVNVSEESFDLFDGLSGYFDDTVEFDGKKTQMKVSLVELPPILQIQLQRVQFNRETLQPYKSHAYVKFGETIAMDRFLDDAPSDKKEKAAEIQKKLSKCRDRIQVLTQGKDGPFAENLEASWTFLSNQKDIELPDVTSGFLDRLNEEKASLNLEITKLRSEATNLKNELEEIWNDEHRAEYELTAVFVHRGGSPSFGHYFIYQRWLPDYPDQWFKFNDSDVSIVPKEEVFADTTGSTANPYLLVYASKGSEVIQTVQRNDLLEVDTPMTDLT